MEVEGVFFITANRVLGVRPVPPITEAKFSICSSGVNCHGIAIRNRNLLGRLGNKNNEKSNDFVIRNLNYRTRDTNQ